MSHKDTILRIAVHDDHVTVGALDRVLTRAQDLVQPWHAQ